MLKKRGDMIRVITSAANITITEASGVLAARKAQRAKPKKGFAAKLLRAPASRRYPAAPLDESGSREHHDRMRS